MPADLTGSFPPLHPPDARASFIFRYGTSDLAVGHFDGTANGHLVYRDLDFFQERFNP